MYFKEGIDNVKPSRRVKKVEDYTSQRSQEHSQETNQDVLVLLPFLVAKAMLLPSATMVVFRSVVFYRTSSSTSLEPFLLHGLDLNR